MNSCRTSGIDFLFPRAPRRMQTTYSKEKPSGRPTADTRASPIVSLYKAAYGSSCTGRFPKALIGSAAVFRQNTVSISLPAPAGE